MTTHSALWLPSATSDAVFRAAVQAYSDALTAVGVLKTADTGQIDTAAVTLPAAVTIGTPVYSGYEIRKLAGVGGKPPLYLKFEYGVTTTTTNSPAQYRFMTRVSAALATDGAGNLDGPAFSANLVTWVSQSGPTSAVSQTLMRPLHMASDGESYLSIINDPTGSAWSASVKFGYLNFCLERSINALTGDYDSEAFVAFNPFFAGSAAVQVLNAANGTSATGGGAVGYQTPSNMWASSGSLTQATIMPVTVCVPTPKGPARATLLAYASDVTFGGQYQVSMYGRLVTYMACGVPYNSDRVNGIVPASVSILMRFE